MADEAQTVTLVLADGRRLAYTGRVQLASGEAVLVTEVLFSRPQPLPPDCSWQSVSEAAGGAAAKAEGGGE